MIVTLKFGLLFKKPCDVLFSLLCGHDKGELDDVVTPLKQFYFTPTLYI